MFIQITEFGVLAEEIKNKDVLQPFSAQKQSNVQQPSLPKHRINQPNLPTYRLEEVMKHNSM